MTRSTICWLLAFSLQLSVFSLSMEARPNRRSVILPRIASDADVTAGEPGVLIDAELLQDVVDNLDGNDGWSPVFAIQNDGVRRVVQVVDWTGGEGTKPTTGLYVGAAGLTATIGDAIDVRGPAGPQGAQGDQGDPGLDGGVGADGRTTWYTASGTPNDSTGVDGDFMWRGSDGSLFLKASGTWGSPVFSLASIASLDIETLTAQAQLIVEAAAPGTPASGRVALYAKTDGLLYSKDDAGTETLVSGGLAGSAPTQCFALTIDAVADSMDYGIGYLPAAATITRMVFVHAGAGLSSPDIDVIIRHGTDRSATGTAVVTAGTTVTSSTTGSVVLGFDDATAEAGSFVWAETSSRSGTTANLELFIFYTYD